jgi:sigma-B regulation protein RsbU (phosphoserine phosphatase)
LKLFPRFSFDGGNRMEGSAAKQQTTTGNPMIPAEQTYLRTELEHRRERLHSALHSPGADGSLSQLLTEVDAALERIDHGSFGLCETCHEAVEPDRLLADPLLRFCLDHLTQEEQRALESDLLLAARIQRGLLPEPELELGAWEVRFHYQPAGMVSGDYCDLFEANGELHFMLGDVSGKGVAASMLMSHLHATFRSLAEASLPLDQMVEHANRIFCESTLAGQFATLIAGRASPDGAVEIVNAGHLPLLHLHDRGSAPKESTGVPLGMFCNTSFRLHQLSLGVGESLFLYTDGLTESRNQIGEEYGLARVQGLANRQSSAHPKALIAGYLEDLSGFRKGIKQTDDLTLLAVRRTA